MEIGPKAVVLCGRCRKSQKNMQRECRSGKEGRREELRKDGEAAKSSKKKAFHAGGVQKSQKKHAAITPVAEEGKERAHHRATEQHTDLQFYQVKLQFVKK